MTDGLVALVEMADRLNVGKNTLTQWVKKGKLDLDGKTLVNGRLSAAFASHREADIRRMVEELRASQQQRTTTQRSAPKPKKHVKRRVKIEPLTADEKRVIVKAWRAGTLTPLSPHFNSPTQPFNRAARAA